MKGSGLFFVVGAGNDDLSLFKRNSYAFDKLHRKLSLRPFDENSVILQRNRCTFRERYRLSSDT